MVLSVLLPLVEEAAVPCSVVIWLLCMLACAETILLCCCSCCGCSAGRGSPAIEASVPICMSIFICSWLLGCLRATPPL